MPRKFHLPSTSIPAERATIVRPARAVAAVRHDECDAALRELRIELVGLVRVVPNEPSGRFLHQPVGQRGLDERDFMRCGTVKRPTRTHCSSVRSRE